MIRLQDLLSEKITDVMWVNKAYKHAWARMFPITPKIAGILNKGERVNAFHITSIQKLDQLKAVQGTKKSISCMTRIPKESIHMSIDGVWHSGVMFYVEGTLMVKGTSDIASEPDEQGRRWASIKNTNISIDWNKLLNNDAKLSAITMKLAKSGQATYTTLQNTPGINNGGELLRSYIDRYVQLAEEFAEKNKNELLQTFNKIDNHTDWDELLLNDIKLVDVIWGKYDNEFGTRIMDERRIANIENKLKSMVSGKVIIANDTSEIKSFVNSHKIKI